MFNPSPLTINLDISSLTRRSAVGLIGLLLFAFLAYGILRSFVAGVLADDRVLPRPDALATLASLAPDDARVQARLAQAEFNSPERDIALAESHARRACELSPWNFQYALSVASIEDAAGNSDQARQALETAARLAPYNRDIHWRLANLLVRKGMTERAAAQFKLVCSSASDLLPLALETIWQSSGDPQWVIAATPPDSASQINLAGYLLARDQIDPAITVFNSVNPQAALASPLTKTFIDSLIKIGQPAVARREWCRMNGLSGGYFPLVANGSFESSVKSALPEFDWQLSSNKYADVSIDSKTGRTGSRSLRISFTALDTTVLDHQVSQLTVLQPGAHYLLTCYVKASNFVSPEGPRFTITDAASGTVIASSEPIKPGNYNWQTFSVDFVAPSPQSSNYVPAAAQSSSAAQSEQGIAVNISLIRKPKFSYDDPTRGTIWLDDFELTQKQP